MAKLPYGFDANQPYFNDDSLHKGSTEAAAWAMLEEVQDYLAKNEPMPPELAAWLGEAIRHSNRNSGEFLQRLGLKKRQGENSPYNRQFKAHWQSRLWHLGTYNEAGLKAEQIVMAVKSEMTAEGIPEDGQPNRETLQDWLSEAMTGSKRAR